MKPQPIAILCSDLHLSLQKPACRANDDWLAVQAEYLWQLRKVAGVNDANPHHERGLPVICAGDIFDRWNAPAELINFALEYLPDGMLCVPGQHDLPNHRLEEVHRSGYGVLVKAGKIKNIHSRPGWNFNGGVVFGFPWGDEILPCPFPHKQGIVHIAVIHRYVWTIGASYPGAPEDAHLGALMPALKGYDAAVFGDNHKGFHKKLKTRTHVLNCGTFIRRKSDEIGYQPQVGILYSDGSIQPKKLDTSIDQFHAQAKEREEIAVNMKEFIEGLEKLGEHGLDFREAVERRLEEDHVDDAVRSIVLQSLEARDNKQ